MAERPYPLSIEDHMDLSSESADRPRPMGRFDVVIVGAGSAGCVLAARLSEDPTRSVCLLEAGPGWPAPDAIAGSSFHQAIAQPGWSYPDLMVTFSPTQEPRRYLRGRGLGGSSAVNAMVAIPGIPDDYDRWERLGATGWGWSDLQPWFARTRLTLFAAARHEVGALSQAVLRALPANSMVAPLTRTADGRRVSSADAYLADAIDRPNLGVHVDTAVDQILFEGRSARGVRLCDGTEIEAAHVLVSAGAIHSPQLLLRSAVETPGIGEGLKDHASLRLSVEMREPADVTSLPISVIARMSSGESPADLQLLPNDHIGMAEAPNVAMLLVGLMQVSSVGRVTRDAVDFNLLSTETDRRRLRRGGEIATTLMAQLSDVARSVAPLDLSDEGLLATVGDYVHATSTCAIGRVVDSRCAVIGYTGLSVCDASVMPDLPRANTHFTTVVIAERFASLWSEACVPEPQR